MLSKLNITTSDSAAVIPDSAAVIPDRLFVIPDLIRDPVPRDHWIADRVRNDTTTPAMTPPLPQ
jgi:hypothetical protein